MRPVLFQLGPIAVRAYGAMLVLAFAVGILWAMREARLRRLGCRLPPERMIDTGLAALIGGLIGARILFVILDPNLGWRDLPFIWRGGLSFHGGLIGGITAVFAYAFAVRVNPGLLFDAGAPSMALGYAIARIGCLLNGCCYGCPTNLPWGLRFPDLATGGLTPPSHPTQIYSSLGSLVLFGILLRMRPLARVPGQLFIAYVGLYGVLRFIVEIFRKGYTAEVAIGPLTQAQVASIGLVVFAIIGWFALKAMGARRDAVAGG